MSNTTRHVTPGWGPSHPHWPERFGQMSPKEQSRDRAPRQLGRHHRFHNHGRNSLFNLRLKNDLLRDKEARVA